MGIVCYVYTVRYSFFLFFVCFLILSVFVRLLLPDWVNKDEYI